MIPASVRPFLQRADRGVPRIRYLGPHRRGESARKARALTRAGRARGRDVVVNRVEQATDEVEPQEVARVRIG